MYEQMDYEMLKGRMEDMRRDAERSRLLAGARLAAPHGTVTGLRVAAGEAMIRFGRWLAGPPAPAAIGRS